MFENLRFYKANNNLKAAGVQVPFTEDNIAEYIKCAKDPIYFIETYAKIVSLDDGVIPFKLFEFQKDLIRAMHENRNTIGLLPRQFGKSTTVAGYFAWYVLFNDNKTAVILANKQAIAVEIFSRVQFIIENIPQWLQQGVVEWNKKSFELENGSKVVAAASSPSAVRGMSVNVLLCDEFAHLGPNLADDFIASVFPTLSSSESSKLIIISTPNGLNHYHKLWVEAENGNNDFTPVKVNWYEHPKRTQEWAEAQRKKLGDVRYRQEVEVEFQGSSYTLIDGSKLAGLPIETPVFQNDNLEIFEAPDKNKNYVITVDVSRGRHRDFSAFSIIDVSQMPYRIIGTYKDNTISTLEYPHLIYNTARQYNNAFILIEINDLGEEVSNIIWNEYEYENMYFTLGDKLTQGRGYPGVRTTTKVKGLGCSVLKELIEKDQLLIRSHKIIEELGIFVLNKKSYASEDPAINDDLCTTLWLFAWLTKQDIFQEVTNINLRGTLIEQKQDYINKQLTPFGFFNDGRSEEEDNSKIPVTGTFLTRDQIELLSL